MVRPKKHLGQHFLTDQNIAEKISGSLSADGSDAIIEVGPGKGILTAYLRKREGIRFYTVEIDAESIAYLEDKYPELSENIIEADFLRLDLAQYGQKLALIGNFPYNISSQIFFRVLNYRERVDEVVCMIQKEVAERISSKAGNKQYGILSVFLQLWYDIKILFHVEPGSFFPPPKVRSSVVRLTRNNRSSIECREEMLYRIVKMAFNQRRKQMRNSLKSILVNLDEEIPYLTLRPEQLTVDQFIELCVAIENANPQK